MHEPRCEAGPESSPGGGISGDRPQTRAEETRAGERPEERIAELESEVRRLRAELHRVSQTQPSSEPVLGEGPISFLADSVPALVWASGRTMDCTFFNRYWLEFTGRTMDQELGAGWAEGLHPDDRARCFEVYEKAFQVRANYRMEYRLRRYDGEYRWMLDTGVPYSAPDGAFLGYVGCCTDITLLKQAEDSLRETGDLLRAVIEGTTDVVFVRNRKGVHSIMSSSGPQWLMDSLEDALAGRPSRIREEDAQRLRDEDRIVMATGESTTRELVIEDRSGSRRTLRVRKVPYRDRTGQMTGVIGVVEDVSDRMRMENELRQLQNELAHVGRLGILGEMSASIAHELNQPLAAISTYTESCRRLLTRDRGSVSPDEILCKIRDQAHRAGEIIRSLRDFCDKRSRQHSHLQLGRLIEEVSRLIGPEIRSDGIGLSLEVPSGLPLIKGDSVQLQQVLMNLIRNAMDSIRESTPWSGLITVRVERWEEGQVRIEVRDSGPGFRGEDPETFFEPFRSTKDDGIGVGLPISRTIVEAHGGRLWGQTNPGGEPSFFVVLPMVIDGGVSSVRSEKGS